MQTNFDSEQYKKGQEQNWNSLAQSWYKWEPLFEKGAIKMTQWMIDQSIVEADHQILDIASGLGEPAISFARELSPGGKIFCVEISEEMISIAKNRDHDPVLIEFIQSDAEKITFPENNFNTIISRWGLMFLPNFQSTIEKFSKILKPGGCLVASVWDAPAKVPMISLTFGVIARILELPPPPAGTPSPFCLCNIDALKEIILRSGFSHITTEVVEVPFEVSSFEEYREFSWDLLPAGIKQMVLNKDAETQKKIWEEVQNALAIYSQNDGTYKLTSRAIGFKAIV